MGGEIVFVPALLLFGLIVAGVATAVVGHSLFRAHLASMLVVSFLGLVFAILLQIILSLATRSFRGWSFLVLIFFSQALLIYITISQPSRGYKIFSSLSLPLISCVVVALAWYGVRHAFT
jgi:hypothetical protein